MYCVKCGKEIAEGNNFCANCGSRIMNMDDYKQHSLLEKNKMKNTSGMQVIVLLLILIGVSSMVLLIPKKTDLDKMIGTWYCEEEDWEMTLYEPDDEKNKGDIEVIDLGSGDYTFGAYEWHEGSKMLELREGLNEITYIYEILDDDNLILCVATDEGEQFEFERVR